MQGMMGDVTTELLLKLQAVIDKQSITDRFIFQSGIIVAIVYYRYIFEKYSEHIQSVYQYFIDICFELMMYCSVCFSFEILDFSMFEFSFYFKLKYFWSPYRKFISSILFYHNYSGMLCLPFAASTLDELKKSVDSVNTVLTRKKEQLLPIRSIARKRNAINSRIFLRTEDTNE